MTTTEAVLLGILQGLTEFLPVSSSGHLVIFQNIFGLKQPGITFEVMVHLGTLLSVFWVFWADIKYLIINHREPHNRRFMLLLLWGTVPAAFAGLVFGDIFERIFHAPLIAPAMLLVTGAILWKANNMSQRGKNDAQISGRDAFLIGIAQALAIFPGLSRSGATITAALWRGLNRETAVRFSFLLSILAISGASFLETVNLLQNGTGFELWTPYLIAAIAAFLSGVLAIKLFIRALQTKKFHIFAIYCWVVGILILFYNILNI